MKLPNIESMAVQQRCEVAIAGDVHSARRLVGELARGLVFDEASQARLASLVAQCTSQLLVDAGRGELLVRPLSVRGASDARRVGIELITVRAQACASNFAAFADEMRCDADELDLWSSPGQGSALRALVWSHPAGGGAPYATSDIYGVISLAVRGESVNGDAWSCHVGDGDVTVLVADGLGHGPLANRAATQAAKVLTENGDAPLDLIVHAAHDALRATVGAAVGVARFPIFTDVLSGRIQFAGVGNISASVWTERLHKHLASHDGVVGDALRRVQQFEADCPANAIVVLHSDGLTSRWDLLHYGGLAARHPALIAAVLYRDFARDRDDVTVFVARVRECAIDASADRTT